MLALRLKRALNLLAAFGAGAMMGVALFDLLPEALGLGAPGQPAGLATGLMGLGFALALVADRAAPGLARAAGWRGHAAGAALSLHSLMDGLAIGLAFDASSSAGVAVAAAVLTHDFVDGANTVGLSLAGGAGRAAARRWLIVDSLAPLAGLLLSRLFAATGAQLAMLLSLFAGGFLYAGSRRLSAAAPGALALAAAGATGLAAIALVTRLAG